MNTMGAPRASAHRHSNSYPGVQPMSGTRATFVDTPTSGLPYTSARSVTVTLHVCDILADGCSVFVGKKMVYS